MNSESPWTEEAILLQGEILTPLLESFRQVMLSARDQNKRTSRDLNYFRLFHIGETDHSYLLAKFLDAHAEHGQGKLFLVEFLTKLGIKEPSTGPWVVSREKGNIDVLLKREKPHSVVIIENKSNYAVDRPNQLYRYWYQEIFVPNKGQTDPVSHIRENSDRYRIVYLSPKKGKLPAENSLQRPSPCDDYNDYTDYTDELLPAKIEIDKDFIQWSFDKEIIEWLFACRESLHKQNFRLRDFVNQYIELWESMMPKELVTQAMAMFDTAEKWSAYVILSGIRDSLSREYYQKLSELILEHFQSMPFGWRCERWGDGLADFRWFLGEFGKNSIAIASIHSCEIWLDVQDKTSFNVKRIAELLDTHDYAPILDAFDRIDVHYDGSVFAKEKRNYRFDDSPYNGHFDEYQLDWYAGNRTEDLARQIIEKVERFTTSETLTSLLRKLNGETA